VPICTTLGLRWEIHKMSLYGYWRFDKGEATRSEGSCRCHGQLGGC